MKKNYIIKSDLCRFFCFMMLCVSTWQSQAQTEAFSFDPVTIGGGGYITNILAHPADPELKYIRTDVGGCYRWDANANQWIQLLNFLDPATAGLNSVDGMAVAATDTNLLYIACGNAQDSGDINDVLKSTDQGQNWIRTNLNVDLAFEGNQRDVRYIGERIAVDPLNANYVYVGTKQDGLYRTTDAALSWQSIGNIPGGSINSTASAKIVGIRNVVFDPSETVGSGSTLRSKTIYVGAYEDGIYQSTDGGETFSKMSGSPETVRRIKLASNGDLWVTTAYPIGSDVSTLGGGRVYHFDGSTWHNKTPENPSDNKPYGAIAIDPTDSDRVIVSQGKNKSNQPIYRTTNASANNPTWVKINPTPSSPNKLQPGWWETHFFGTGPANFVMTSDQPGQLWMSDGFGVWQTDDVWQSDESDIIWTARVQGIEELVMMTTCTPPAPNSTSLFSGAADADGFAHNDLSTFPSETLQPGDWASTSLDYVATDPTKMIRLLTSKTSGGEAYWSDDSGVTWNKTTSSPRSGSITLGKAAVSATTLDKMVVVPAYNAWEIGQTAITLKYTDDRGATWKDTNLTFDPGPIDNWWAHDHPIVADKVDGNTFYFFYKRKSEFYRSTDGGATFQLLHTFPNHENIWGKPTKYWQQWAYVRTMPGSANEVWISLPQDGLFKSTDGGANWTQINGFENVRGLAFGKEASGQSTAAIYILADAGTGLGLFGSDNDGQSWYRCDDNTFNFGIPINNLGADKQTYGRVYISTGGRGIVQANRGSLPPPAVDFKPIAKISADILTGDKPLIVNFDGSESVDPDGGSLSYSWDFGDGNTSTGQSPTHTFTEYGSYTVTLTVTNTQSEVASTTVEILVNGLPSIEWQSPEQGANFNIGETATLAVAVDDPNGLSDIDRVIFWDENWNWLHTDWDGPDYTFDATINLGANKFRAEVYDLQGSKTSTDLLTVNGGANTPTDFVYGVNFGGSAFQDTEGYIYNASENTSGGSTFSTTDAISGTSDDALYQSELVGNALTISIPLANDTYDVVLKFAELGWEVPNERIFDVNIEGSLVIDDLDIYSEAGHDTAYDRLFTVAVSDGSLDIDFGVVSRSPKINALLIKTASATIPVSQVSIDQTQTDLLEGESLQLSATVSPANATNPAITWLSDDTSVATVSSSGLVTAVAAGQASITAVAQDGSGQQDQIHLSISAPLQTGSISRAYWTGISGKDIQDLLDDPNYPDSPTGTDELLQLEAVDWNDPTINQSWGSDYGQRIQGYLVPPSTGTYYFWIAGDDDCQLFLSTDDQEGNKTMIAEVNGWSQQYEWNKYTSQKSAAITLSANQAYYIEVLHKEAGGGDRVAVGWAKPGESTTSPSAVIPGTSLMPIGEVSTPDTTAPDVPVGLSATASDGQVALSWSDNTEGDLAGYKLYRSTTSGSGYSAVNTATLTSSSYTDTGVSNGTTYYYVVSAIDQTGNESAYSAEVSASPTASSQSNNLQLNPIDDTYIDQNNAGNNYGNSSTLRVQHKPSPEFPTPADKEALIKFDLSQISGTVTGATLRMRIKLNRAVDHQLSVGTDNTWDELSATWTNTHPIASTAISSYTLPASGTWVDTDVTSAVAQAVSADVVSFHLSAITSSGGYAEYWSVNSGNAPILDIDYDCTSCRTMKPSVASPSQSMSFSIHPNPTHGQAVTLTWEKDDKSDQATINIYTLLGTRIHSEVLNNLGNASLAPELFEHSGIYVIELRQGNQQWRKRLMMD